jgi:HK97 family phage major capsid protein
MVKAKERTVDLAFSSELPYCRWWGIEILDHSPGAMRMDRAKDGIAVLFNHGRDAHLGIMSDCRCDSDKVGRGTARFGQGPMASEKLQDVEDGILKDVSVGYEIHFMQEMDPKEMGPELMEMAAREKLPVYRITDWEPFECSFVTVPADPTVGVGRTLDPDQGGAEGREVKPPGALPGEGTQSSEAPSGASVVSGQKIKEGQKMSDEKKEKDVAEYEQDRAKAVHEAKASEGRRQSEIWALSTKHNLPAMLRDKHLAEGTTIEQFRGIVLDRIGPGKPLDTPMGEVGLSGAEVRKYSFLRACRAAISKDWRGAEFERECSLEISKKVGSDPRSFFLPYDLLTARRSPEEIRALNATTAGEGGYLKGTTQMAGSFIELLRARLVAAQAGVGIMSGLVGNIDIPKQTGATTAYWVGEGVDITEGAPTFGQVTLSPKSIGAYVDITRRLLLQSAPAADGIVMADITRVLGLGIDKAVFHGAGTAEPTGIDITSNIGTFTGTTFSRILAVSALTDVMNANADKAGMSWVTNPTGWGILKVREMGTAGYPIYLCDDQDKMLGFPVLTSTQIQSANLFFGDFTQAIIGEWGVLDINVDDKSLSKSGGIRIVGFQSIDVAVRNAGAFTLAENLS